VHHEDNSVHRRHSGEGVNESTILFCQDRRHSGLNWAISLKTGTVWKPKRALTFGYDQSTRFRSDAIDSTYPVGHSMGGGGADGFTAATLSNATMQRHSPTVCPLRNAGRALHHACSIRGASSGTMSSVLRSAERKNPRSTHFSHRTHPTPAFLPMTLYPWTLLTAPARTRKEE
jgi:hypothetical protein